MITIYYECNIIGPDKPIIPYTPLFRVYFLYPFGGDDLWQSNHMERALSMYRLETVKRLKYREKAKYTKYKKR